MLTSALFYGSIILLSMLAGFIAAVFLQEKRDSLYVDDLRAEEGKDLTDTWGRSWGAHVWKAEPKEFAVLLKSYDMKVEGDYMFFNRRNKAEPLSPEAMGKLESGERVRARQEAKRWQAERGVIPAYERIAMRLKELDSESTASSG